MANFTNAQLAQKMSDLIAFWSSFNEEYASWLGGAVDGGPSSDGLFPLTDYTGVESLVACPALLSDNVSGYVGIVAASAAAALVSENAAAASESTATAQAVIATAQAVLADADRIAALAAEQGAIDAKVVAIAQAAIATAKAVLTANDAIATAADAVQTGLDAAAAAASAAAAATFNPALYAALADPESVVGLWDFNTMKFNPITAPAHVEGKVFYDTDTKSLAYYNDEAEVTLNIGQENYLRARNTTGVTILEGSVVYVNGATGNRVNIALAQSDDAPQLTAVGVATHDIENNTDGYVTVLGVVHNLDTSSYSAGDEIFLSSSVAGGFTSTVPTYPNRIVPVGRVLTVNPTVGTIYVNIGSWHGYTLPEANEIITGSWTFSGTTPQFQMAETDATVDEGNWIFKAAGDSFKIATASDASPGTAVDSFLSILRTGTDATRLSLTTDLYLRAGKNFLMYTDDDLSAITINPGATGASVTSFSTPNALRISTGGTFADFRAGTKLRVNDAANTNKITLSHDGTHGTIDGNAVGDLKFTDWLNVTMSGALAVTGAVTGSNLAVANWNTAYGWGDHASGGYAASSHVHEGTAIDATAVTDGFVLTADGAGNSVWEAASGGIVDIVDDTTPQLGGALDTQGFAITGASDATFADIIGSQLTMSRASSGLNNSINLISLTPGIYFGETSEPADEGGYKMYVAAGDMRLYTTTDLGAASQNIFYVNRGTGTAVVDMDFNVDISFKQGLNKSGLGIPYYVTAGYVGGTIDVQTTEPTSPTQGDLWIDSDATYAAGDMGDLGDVTITSIASGELLTWNGTAFINETLAQAGIQAADADTAKTDVAETITAAWNFTGVPTKSSLGIPYHISAGYVGGKISVTSTTPTSPTKGDIWFDTT